MSKSQPDEIEKKQGIQAVHAFHHHFIELKLCLMIFHVAFLLTILVMNNNENNV